jgi:hypothetical protein
VNPGQTNKPASLRQKSFLLFDYGLRPAAVADSEGMKKTTAFRYFQQWKKLAPMAVSRYRLARRLFRRLSREDRKTVAAILASELDGTQDRVIDRMARPCQ